MKMQYFHQEGGGRTPGMPYAGSATVHGVSQIFYNNPLETRVSRVLTLWGLGYYVPHALIICRLD